MAFAGFPQKKQASTPDEPIRLSATHVERDRPGYRFRGEIASRPVRRERRLPRIESTIDIGPAGVIDVRASRIAS